MASRNHRTMGMDPATSERMNQLNQLSSQRRSLEVLGRQSSKNETENDDPNKRHSLTSTSQRHLWEKNQQIRKHRQKEFQKTRLQMKKEVENYRKNWQDSNLDEKRQEMAQSQLQGQSEEQESQLQSQYQGQYQGQSRLHRRQHGPIVGASHVKVEKIKKHENVETNHNYDSHGIEIINGNHGNKVDKVDKVDKEQVAHSRNHNYTRDHNGNVDNSNVKSNNNNDSNNDSNNDNNCDYNASNESKIENEKKGSSGAGGGKMKKMFSRLTGNNNNNNKQNGNSKNQKVKISFKLEDEKFVLYKYYEPRKKLGKGAYAVVCEALDKRTSDLVAIKKNRRVFVNISDAKRILREIKLLGWMNHENIMHLLTTIPPEPYEIDSYNDVYLVMPRMDRSLTDVIRSDQKLSEQHMQFFMYQIVLGLAYIHSGGIIHRDLKPDNVLVNVKDCHLKITDFGLARGVLEAKDAQKLTEYVVTRWYRAPEVMVCSRRYNEKVDLWAAGCIAGELFTRKPLFKGRNHIEQLTLIFHYLGTPKTFDWITADDARMWIKSLPSQNGQNIRCWFPKASYQACDFISKLLAINPNDRMSALEALEHPWLSDFYDKKSIKLSQCPRFDLTFEFEQKLNTEFGVRHMMYDEIVNYKKNRVKTLKMHNEYNARMYKHKKDKTSL